MANEWFETVAVARKRAQRRLPRSVYGAIVAGAEAGVSAADNLRAFDLLGLRPVAAGQPATRDLATTIMGQPSSLPVMISPTGVQAVHPDGEVAVGVVVVPVVVVDDREAQNNCPVGDDDSH